MWLQKESNARIADLFHGTAANTVRAGNKITEVQKYNTLETLISRHEVVVSSL
jgi:hypothetical protein